MTDTPIDLNAAFLASAAVEAEHYARSAAQLNSPYQIARHAAAVEKRRLAGEAKQSAYAAKYDAEQAKIQAKVLYKLEHRDQIEAKRERKRVLRKAAKSIKQRNAQRAWTPEQRAAWNIKQRAYYKVRRDKLKAAAKRHIVSYEPPIKVDPVEVANVEQFLAGLGK